MCGIVPDMEEMSKLTPKQRKVLDFIREQVLRQNMPPTIREVAMELGFSSTGTVRDYLDVLEKKGYLRRSDNKSRGIELTDEGFGRIPIISSIAAGKPSLAYEDIEGYVDADDLFLGRASQDDVFALRVQGKSMIEAGIMDGDVAIIKKVISADNGDVVAALLDNNEATLKILKKPHGSRPYLEAANKDYPPIYKEFSVIGKLITILRKYR